MGFSSTTSLCRPFINCARGCCSFFSFFVVVLIQRLYYHPLYVRTFVFQFAGELMFWNPPFACLAAFSSGNFTQIKCWQGRKPWNKWDATLRVSFIAWLIGLLGNCGFLSAHRRGKRNRITKSNVFVIYSMSTLIEVKAWSDSELRRTFVILLVLCDPFVDFSLYFSISLRLSLFVSLSVPTLHTLSLLTLIFHTETHKHKHAQTYTYTRDSMSLFLPISSVYPS